MKYLLKQTKQNFFSGKVFKSLLILCLVLILFTTFNMSDWARSMTADLTSPLFKAGNYFYSIVLKTPMLFLSKDGLLQENEKLLRELQDLQIDEVSYESVKYENQRLREELGVRPEGRLITASIIAGYPQVPIDTLFIDRGVGSGISKGDLVLAKERILIGRVVDVTKNRSTIALGSLAGNISYAFVERTDEPIEVEGAGGGSIRAKVPIDFDVIPGDKIMVRGPVTYFTAIVNVVEEERSPGFKSVLMLSPINISKLSFVFVKSALNE